eukprot:CCRYP_017430-RA/>CCRYP_017430-RA protein AED:0.37 eAED:0.37 QI:0/0/0/1/0/0.33/3/0/324
MVIYDSGADGHYLSETDRRAAGLPILKPSTKRLGMANGSTSQGTHVTPLPFPKLSPQALQADSFSDFLIPSRALAKQQTTRQSPSSHEMVSLFMLKKTSSSHAMHANAHWDAHGCYRIPLWQPLQPSKLAQAASYKANSVYDLPSTEQVIKWLHAVCGYPVKSTWMKAMKAGNFHRSPLLTATNVLKYYPETVKTPKGHHNQTQKNVRSTKPKHPFKELHSTHLCGQKERDIYTKVYDTRDTIFTDQTGKFPTHSEAGHQYIMIMAEINSSSILVEPLKNSKDAELTRAYTTLMSRLHHARIQRCKHILDNKISQAMKDLIHNK